MSVGPGNWKRLYTRVLAMDWAEVSDRLRQHVSARVDLLRYRLGADFEPPLAAPMAQSSFFFSPEAVPGLCETLRRRFPEIAARIVERAQRICEHRFDLLGYCSVDYGPDIDWHSDQIHGKRAPRKPWFQVRYLDFGEVGDSKVTWELNRHQHFMVLAKAYRLTGDDKFATELFRQWDNWHAENPYPIGINWASSLEVGFRSLSWLWVYFLLAGSPAVTTEFRARWLRSLAVSGRHVDRYLSTYFSPNTHLLGEGVALFFIGTLCPEISAARRWQQRGWEIVRQEAQRQVRADGLHFEQSVYYHVYALDLFLHAVILASVNQIEIPTQLHRTVERMSESLLLLARGASVPQFGDDDGGRLFDGARNRAEDLLDPLATSAVLFGRGDFKTLAAAPREETLWLLGEAGIEKFDRIQALPPARNSVALQSSGVYVIADEDGRQLVLDAGPQGAHTAGHGHADALSLTAHAKGCDLLIDCGTFEYVGDDACRDSFRGTRAHNTLLVAGQDQAEPRGPFGWGRLPEVRVEDWIAGKTFDLVVANHDGYSRLQNPVVHRRSIFSLKSRFWLVRDQALGSGECDLDLFWHLGPSLQPLRDDEGVFVGEGHGLSFVTSEDNRWTRSVEEQDHSRVYGKRDSHPVLHFATRSELPAEFATLLLPVADATWSRGKLTRIAGHSNGLSTAGYRYRVAGDEHCIFFSQGETWELDQWSSDAEFVYWGRVDGSPRHTLICCHGSYVKWAGQTVLTSRHVVSGCEIIENKNGIEVIGEGSEAVVVNSEGWDALVSGHVQLAGKVSREDKN